MKRLPVPGARRGFTLVELLVATAIIGVLVGITFPIVQAARRRARSATCVSNMHQIGIALLMYAADWDGCAPPYTTYTSDRLVVGSGETPMVVELAPFNDAAALERCFSPYEGDSAEIWFCPLDPDRGRSEPETEGDRYVIDRAETSYRVDPKFAIWRPVKLDRPPVVSLRYWASAMLERGVGINAVFWTDTDDIDYNAPCYLKCIGEGAASGSRWLHGKRYPVLRLDGTIAWGTSNKGWSGDELRELAH